MFKSTLTILAASLFALTLSAEVVRRGDAVRAVEATPLAEILADPAKFDGATVVTSGVVSRACKKKGCWMELSPEKSERAMRVTFKDYGFFVPLDSQGSAARVDGIVKVKKLSKAEADHFEEDGGRIVRDEDGTAVEISFIANGVELTRPDPS